MKPHFVLFAGSSYYYRDGCVSVCLEMAKQLFIFLVQDGLRVRLGMWIRSGRKEALRRHGVMVFRLLIRSQCSFSPVSPVGASLGPWVGDGYIPLC